MRTTVLSYLDEFLARGGETAFAHRRGLRVVRWSYEQTAKTAYQVARELETREIGKGDRVLLWAKNSRSEEHTSELQSRRDLVCRLLLEKKKTISNNRSSSDSDGV